MSRSHIRPVVGAVLLCLAVSCADLVGVVPGSGAVQAAPPTASYFRGLVPARVLDTRPNGVTVDGAAQGQGALGSGGTVTLTVAGRGGVPASVGAVALNVTAINPTAASFVTVYPAGASRPNASNLNVAAGRTLPNMVIVPVSAAGQVALYNDAGETHLAVDVLGWFPPGDGFSGLSPARLLDSRTNGATVDGQAQGIGPRGPRSSTPLQVTGRGGVPASGVAAVVLNVTAISPTHASFVTVHPSGAARPNASNLNLAPGRTLPNLVVVPVGAGGKVAIYHDTGSTHLAVDVLGWFPEGDDVTGLNPARLLDTRANGATVDGTHRGGGAVGATGSIEVEIAGRGGVPAVGAGAAVLNVTAINPTAASFVTVYPSGASRPNASNLNLAAGRTLPNLVIVPLGTGGRVTIYNQAGSTHLAVDVLAWFPPAVVPASTTRVNVSSAGVPANGPSQLPSLSADGRFVAFESEGNNLVANDTNGASDVFVHDRQTGVTTRVSVSTGGGQAQGWSSNARISGNGRFVAFESTAPNLVANDTNSVKDIFVHDLVTGVTERVNLTSAGGQSGAAADHPTISDDGRMVAFHSGASDLVDGDLAVPDVFVRDRVAMTTTLVSASSAGVPGNDTSFLASIAGNGRFVAFSSLATNLVPADTNAAGDVFVRDLVGGATTRVSVANGGVQSNANSWKPAISTDGRFVAFSSTATNLGPVGPGGTENVYLHDRSSGSTTLASRTTGGSGGNGKSEVPAISGSGRYVGFHTYATDLVPGDSNNQLDVAIFDRLVPGLVAANRSTDGVKGTTAAYQAALNGDGRYVAFASTASNLVPGDAPGSLDIFVHDQGTA